MKENKISAIILSDNETIMVSGNGSISRVVKTTLEGLAVSALSHLVTGEIGRFVADVSLNDQAWEAKKEKRGKTPFLDNLKCIGAPINAASNMYYKTHNKVVDIARTPVLGSIKSKED